MMRIIKMNVSLRVWGVVLVTLLCFAASGALCGCGVAESSESQRVERAEFEKEKLIVKVGETKTNRVTGASELSLISSSDVVSMAIDGCVVSVTGLSVGKGEVAVRADGKRLAFAVEVVAREDEEESTPTDVAENLADSTLRITLGKRCMHYGVVGSMFMRSKDWKRIRAVNIDSGEDMEFSCGDDSFVGGDVPRVGVEFEEMPGAWMKINGNDVVFKSCAVVSRNSKGVWIRVVCENEGVAWIVVPSDF